MRTTAAAIVWVCLTGLLASASADDRAPVTTRQQTHMSTYVTISVAAPESPEVLAAIEAAFAEVARLSQSLSEWRPDSEISAVNARAGKAAVAVGPELFEVARLARQVSVDSDGAFDVTFDALSGLWNFKAVQPKVPDAAAISARVALVDYRQLVLDEKRKTLFLGKKGMRVGLGGIAKGYIVDRASRALRAKGFPNHLVIAGGDLYAAGSRGDRPWRIGIRHPRDRNIYATLDLKDEGVATSGNYEKYFVHEGVRYHHLLDPHTGRPARGVSSVTAVASSAAMADAFATALFVMGVERGLSLCQSRSDLEAYYFDEAFEPHASTALARRVRVLPKPATER